MSTANKPEKKGANKFLLVLSILMAGVATASLGYAYKSQARAHSAPEQVTKTTSYFSLAPTFVVNLADEDGPRYLSAEVQLVTRDEKTLAAVTTHAPAIRNRLVMLFGQQTTDLLRQRTAKERLQKEALAEVKAVLAAEKAAANLDGVLFTSLVTQ